MKHKSILLLLLSLLFSSVAFSQQGIVTGVLSDTSGLPLPGVSIIVKGTSNGTQSDFDGNYSITCNVGDTLVFSYIGQKTKEVVVTAGMFSEVSGVNMVRYTPVEPVRSDAYSDAVKKVEKIKHIAPDLEDSNRTYNRNNPYFQYNRIKSVAIEDDKVKLTYFSPDIYFEAGYSSGFGLQFIKDRNLPELQRSFSQGIASGGSLAFRGAETGTVFSYGPALSSLEFDGSNYPYDVHGALVPQGSGNGNPAIAYDNTVFNTVINNYNHVFFTINTSDELLKFDFNTANAKDMYGRERNTNNTLTLKYERNSRDNKPGWNTFITYGNVTDNQPDINGFQNNLLLNLWATPPTFSNAQDDVLPDDTQRSFSPVFNNPEWLLNHNRNAINKKHFSGSIQNDINLNDDITLDSKLNYTYNKEIQKFGIIRGAAGFDDGYSSDKGIENRQLNAVLNFNYRKYFNNNEIGIRSVINYTHENVGFSLQEADDFDPFSFNNPQNSSEINRSGNRSVLRILSQFKYEIDDAVEFTFTNNSYSSSIQNNNWFLPAFRIKADLDRLFDMHGIHRFSIAATASFDINDTPLYYRNLSHNSLLLLPEESLNYTSNNDLFADASVRLEKKENYEISTSFGMNFYPFFLDFDFTYFNTKSKGSVFPVLDGGAFQLRNVADIRNSGIEFNIASSISIGEDFYYRPTIIFSTYRTKVLTLLDGSERIPISGFSSVSQNLIAGEPAGVIVGSAYARDDQNNMVIGSDGFPLVAAEPQIIGDPIPEYTIGFTHNFEWKRFELNIVIDAQKGGDIWNGTQNVLNYLGTSQQSAEERTISGFVYTGVDESGAINTTEVDFYDPANPISENSFVRYGFEGIAEDAIVDASYINIRSVNISYSISERWTEKPFFREFKVGFYAKNLFTWSEFRGHTPYGGLYGNVSGQGLHFFNTPLRSEVGLTLKIKI